MKEFTICEERFYNEKKIIVVVILLLLTISVVPTVFATDYSGSCLNLFYTTSSVYHSGGYMYNNNSYNRIDTSYVDSQNWFDNIDGGSDSNTFITPSGYSEYASATGGYNYRLAVKNFWNPGTRMYSVGSYNS